jgi:hypothetical protein
MKDLPKDRPAETGTAVAAAIAVIICAILDVDDQDILFAITIIVGAIPGVITWIVNLRRRKEST